ncbi:4-(cytidine 5'-diphospho)-2-C-methyl-D-erythritol kinase [Kordiimonas gwangyangensis]|uniref:4-(cytidine 5'-diphospho)-2-C-methyl-D-erythritol kinase n=1 Tax=Kordiimonas gwangyangensis TaxID=288022 RepID=UPI0003790914|nr:4-(cytidine 5'-diphospho)-2-C-methyl-D-erythritol kinase [Kordiimonas gwangyangensis]
MSTGAEGQSLTVTAPAKVNLFLHITGRRDDGYHLLESLFVFTESGDRITVSPSDRLSFALSGPFAGALAGGENNLVVAAAEALATTAGIAPNVALSLEKNLPVAAGIGGGSADAAATLLALNDFWNLGLSLDELSEIAIRLGADVPACLYQKPLFVQGVGERVREVPLGFEAGILLANPGVELSTPAVFKAFKEAGSAFDGTLGQGVSPWDSLEMLGLNTRNSLEVPAVAACPEVAEVLAFLRSLEGVQMVRMSGSGATCFALLESLEAAAEALKTAEKSQPGWWFMADRVVTG